MRDTEGAEEVVPGFTDFETLGRCPLCEGSTLVEIPRMKHLMRCASCELIFVSPRPTQEAIAASYDEPEGIHVGWRDQAEQRRRLWSKRVSRVRKHVSSGRVLDIGAGFGDFLHVLTEQGSWEAVVGTEVSGAAAKQAREQFDLDVRHGQVEDTGLTGPFDLITLFHVLEHLPFPGATLLHIENLLAPDGHLAIAVPNDSRARLRYLRTRDAVKRPLTKLAGRPYRSGADIYFRAPVPRTEIHLTHFGRATLINALEDLGLAVCESGVDDLSPSPTTSTERLHRLQEMIFSLCKVNTGDAMFLVARKPGATGDVLQAQPRTQPQRDSSVPATADPAGEGVNIGRSPRITKSAGLRPDRRLGVDL